MESTIHDKTEASFDPYAVLHRHLYVLRCAIFSLHILFRLALLSICHHNNIVFSPYRTIIQWLNENESIQHTAGISTTILSSFTSIALSGGMGLNTVRIYLLYYDHEYERILASEKWVIFIDPSVVQNNWLLINRNKYGNEIWIMKWIILPTTIVFVMLWGITAAIFAHYDDKHGESYWTYQYILVILCMVTNLIISIKYWRKYPSFNDNLSIRKEIKYLLVYALFAVVSVIISTVLTIMVSPDLEMLAGIIMPTFLAFFCCISIIYPEKATKIYTRLASVSQSDYKIIEWSEVIKSMDGYEQFASFLEKEFSTENILFVTEYVQFKHEIIKIEKYRVMMEDELKLDYNLILPADIPKSIIAKEFEDKMNKEDTNDQKEHTDEVVFNCVQQIYAKYIDSSTAKMEVNISSSTKYNLTKLLRDNKDNMELDQVLTGMETAVKEISYLMNDSQSRFRKQTVFRELMKKSSIISNN